MLYEVITLVGVPLLVDHRAVLGVIEQPAVAGNGQHPPVFAEVVLPGEAGAGVLEASYNFV